MVRINRRDRLCFPIHAIFPNDRRMQFRNKSQPPYFNKRDQVRMLRMVGLLALVVICMKLAADPGMWSWMFPQSTPDSSGSAETKPPSQDVDFGVKVEEDSGLAPDAFRSLRNEAKPQERNTEPAIAQASPDRLDQQANQKPASPENTPKVGDYEIPIDPQVLAPVEDDWLEIRHREAGAFYTILAKARDIPLKILEDASDDSVDYSVLMIDSEQYRGLPLTVRGTIRRIDKVAVSNPDVRKNYNIQTYYVAWMFTASSGNNPYRLISNTIPSDMPVGEQLEVPAQFTGYFFKRQGYRSQGGLHKAPVLIGKHIRWNRPQTTGTAAIPQDYGLAPYAIGLAVIIAIGLGLMIWRFNVSDKKFGHKHVDHFTSATPTAIQELNNLETTDPKDLFRQMEEDAITAELEREDS